ncbi:MAG: dTMP kinase [Monoglobaceae bacterium]
MERVLAIGKFIVVEGLDGSGKSTQIAMMKAELERRGLRVYVTAEPTDFETGVYIRRILSESLDKDMYLQAALFLADRLEHITHPGHGIKRYLDDGYVVICDRYYFSSFAYQGTASDIEWVMKINLDCEKMIKPDLCLFLDVNPDTCKKRIDTVRETAELYEKDVNTMRKIRDNFLNVFGRLSDTHKIEIIDSNADVDEIFGRCIGFVDKILREDEMNV